MYDVYFRINLNKTALEDKAESKERKAFWVSVFVYLLIIAALVYVIYQNDVKLNEKIDAKRNILAETEAKIKSLEQSHRYVSEEDVLALASWERNRLLWTKKVSALAKILPNNMVYTKLIYLNDVLRLNGIAEIREGEKELDLVLNLVNAIKDEPILMDDFYDVQFVYSNRDNAGDQQVLYFGIKCLVKQPFPSEKEYITEGS